jgi:hypothetical protein
MNTPLKAKEQLTRDAAWDRLRRIGAGLPGAAAEAQLAEMFAAGTPARVDGPTDGMLVGWTDCGATLDRPGRIVLALGKAVTRMGVMPWLGKRFDRQAQRGTNAVTGTAVVLTGLLAPSYRMRKVGDHWEGFDMLNRVEPSVISAGTQVQVLDYETIGTNPWPINRVRDEAVEIAPGVLLGLKLWRQADGYHQLAYWAAKTQIAA